MNKVRLQIKKKSLNIKPIRLCNSLGIEKMDVAPIPFPEIHVPALCFTRTEGGSI